MIELELIGLKKYMDANLIVKDISFRVQTDEKVGIVGANGCGKSTILKLIAGIEPMNYCIGYPNATREGYDEGFICITKNMRCAYLEQIPQYDNSLKVIDVLKSAFDEIRSIESQMHQLEDDMKSLEGVQLERVLKRYSELVELYEMRDGYNTGEKLNRICTGLKFDESFLNTDFNVLSGGEKTRVILGKLLIDNPDILLLDEPTNHLDMDSIEWLEGYLKNYKGIVVIVSHDRYFLDNIVTKMVEIEDMESITYKGNYSAFVSQKEENMRIQYEHYREQQKMIKNMQKTVRELREWAMKADNNKFFKRAASIQIKLDKMERIDKPIFKRKNMRLTFNEAQRSGKETIKAIGLGKSFSDKIIFDDANLLINFGERTALIGPNGSGKTTFLKMLLGEEQPDDGIVELGANTKVAYLPQKITFNDEEVTVLECFREDFSILEGKAREYLSKFMFFGGDVFKKVRHLSGGERIRLKLSQMLFQDINLLILDEPTNHLDINSIETFEEALADFNGTIFFISHDRYFINKIGERVINIENHGFESYSGNYDYYKNIRDSKNDIEIKKPIVKKKVKKQVYVDDTKKKEKAIAKVEVRIEKLEKSLNQIDTEMSNPTIHYDELNELFTKKEVLQEELDRVMEEWVIINN